MRQIADMGAGALDDLAIGLDQRIGLARQRRDLDREIAFQPLGAAGTDFGKAAGMRLSGARPNRTCSAVVSSSATVSAANVMPMARSKLRVSSSISEASPATEIR